MPRFLDKQIKKEEHKAVLIEIMQYGSLLKSEITQLLAAQNIGKKAVEQSIEELIMSSYVVRARSVQQQQDVNPALGSSDPLINTPLVINYN